VFADIQSAIKEHQPMRKINTGRALLGGIVAALIINVIEGVMNGVVLKEDWKAALVALGKSGEVTGNAIAVYNIGGLLYGIVGVWLYCALIGRYGTGSIVSAKAGLVVWTLASMLPNMMMLPSGLLPGNLVAYAVITDFIAIILGVMMGSLLYREQDEPLGRTARA
jgi:hypothetical protein